METNFKITIPKPCHEDWNQMTADETGRFCDSCTKNVVDFTGMKALEIQEFLLKNHSLKVCGRFNNNQINRFKLEIPQSTLMHKMPFHKAFLLTLFVVMGSTLFSCKNHNDQTLGEVEVVNDSIKPKTDSINFHHTIGIVIQKDSSRNPSIREAAVKRGYFLSQEVDKMPITPGGLKNFYDYFISNFEITEEERKANRFMVFSFIIEKDGSLTSPKMIREFDKEVNEKAIKVLLASPKWTPGEFGGKKIRTLYMLPVKINP